MSALQANLKHNGANTNLYCDGRLFFVHGCPACDEMYEATMKPRWEEAKRLAVQLQALGFSELTIYADLWRLGVTGTFSGKRLKVENITGKDEPVIF